MTKAISDVISQTRVATSTLTSSLSPVLFSKPEDLPDDTNSCIKQNFVGHERAKEALEFGLSMSAIGFNVFAMGEHGTGRQTLIKKMLSALAEKQKAPEEWCYVNNFDESHLPLILSVSPGEGKKLIASMNKFIDGLLDLFPEIFDNPGYQRNKSAMIVSLIKNMIKPFQPLKKLP